MISEEKYCELNSLEREKVAKFRKTLSRPEYWDKEGRDIVLTSAGIKVLNEEFGASDSTLTVMKIPINPHLLMCETWEGKQAVVRVKDNKLFVRGMDVRAMKTEMDWVYEYSGKYPRYKGKY